jgi:hypothetical protein
MQQISISNLNQASLPELSLQQIAMMGGRYVGDWDRHKLLDGSLASNRLSPAAIGRRLVLEDISRPGTGIIARIDLGLSVEAKGRAYFE